MATWDATRDRVETYFDRTAHAAWERLTSDAPVSRIRATVRAGRDRMRSLMLSRLPADLHGARILDAGCGAGQMSAALAARGADVVAVDVSPRLVSLAEARLPAGLPGQVHFVAGDMLAEDLGPFDHVLAMDSLIYYRTPDLAVALARLGQRTVSSITITIAPRTPALMALWAAGRAFPRADRAPVMAPQGAAALARLTEGRASKVERVTSGFYISECWDYAA